MTSTKRKKRLAKLKKQRNMAKNNYSYRTEYKFVEVIPTEVGKPQSGMPDDGEFVINKPQK